MIEDGLFSHFLKSLLQKKNQKEGIQSVLDVYIKTPHTFSHQGLQIRIQKISPTQKRELMLYKDQIEKDLAGLLSKKYTIYF